ASSFAISANAPFLHAESNCASSAPRFSPAPRPFLIKKNLTNSSRVSTRGLSAGVMAHGELQYRSDIDGLRAVAIGCVLVFHAFPTAFPGGFVGVDVFFVISGFLVGAMIWKRLTAASFS